MLFQNPTMLASAHNDDADTQKPKTNNSFFMDNPLNLTIFIR